MGNDVLSKVEGRWVSLTLISITLSYFTYYDSNFNPIKDIYILFIHSFSVGWRYIHHRIQQEER